MKRLTLTILLLSQCWGALATTPCDNALSACMDYSKTLEDQNKTLKDQVTRLEGTIRSTNDPLIPPLGWALIGAVLGGVAVYEIRK